MRHIAFAFAIALCSWQAHAELSSEIIEFGYYQPVGDLERERNYNTATGYVVTGDDVRLVEQTTDIPMALGRLFGFKFRVRGFPRDEVTANLELAVSHPQIQRPNGTTISGYRIPVVMDVIGGKIENQAGYKFDREYEMVAGEWKFQYWRNNELLVEQSFKVYDPALVPPAADPAAGATQPAAPTQPSATAATTQAPAVAPPQTPEQP